ncbi:MAG: ABC transporter ATP-binding protein, partial [Chloroflexi bacterium]|nr:ABC transporter ATP-binding protein [Chloroflexota bacterium]
MSVAQPILGYLATIEEKPKDFRLTLRTFRRILTYHKGSLPLILLIVAMAALRSYLFTLEPIYTSRIIDEVITPRNLDPLRGLLIKTLLAGSGWALANFAVLYLNGVLAQDVVGRMRAAYNRSVQDKSFTFFDTNAVGDLTSRATTDMQFVDNFLRTWLSVVANTLFTVGLNFYMMYRTSPMLSLIALLPMPFIFFLQARAFRQTMPLFRKMQLTLGNVGAYVQQNIVGMKNVRIFQREAEMDEGSQQLSELFAGIAIRAGKIQALYMPTAPNILMLGVALVYIYGTNLVLDGVLTLGGILLFARYMMRTANPLREMAMFTGSMVNATSAAERMFAIMAMPGDAQDTPQARDRVIERGEIEFRDVTFGYVADRPVLRNISFTARPGETIAILGATGSGKTSLMFLIPRFYEVHAGSILIDGVDSRDYTVHSLRRQIGLVLQDVFLFAGTIKSNIAFGRPDASLEEVRAAAHAARIDDFIEALPDQYDTEVGERGVTLSGGQKQRLTIARALLTDPRILILDDSLSFVDARTEQSIQEAIDDALRD